MMMTKKMVVLSGMAIGMFFPHAWGAEQKFTIVRSYLHHQVLYDQSNQSYTLMQKVTAPSLECAYQIMYDPSNQSYMLMQQIAPSCVMKEHKPFGQFPLEREILLYHGELKYAQFEGSAAPFFERDQSGRVKMFHILSGENQVENVKQFQNHIAETGPIVGYELLFNRDNAGSTPWHSVITKQHVVVMKAIIDFIKQNKDLNMFFGGDALWRLLITRRCNAGFTPLHDLVVADKIVGAFTLLNATPEDKRSELLQVPDFAGQSALEWCKLDNKPDMFELLLAYATPELKEKMADKNPKS